MARALASAEYDRDKYDRRRKAYVSAVAPLLRHTDVSDDRTQVMIPYAVWDAFASDLAAISNGRIPEPRS